MKFRSRLLLMFAALVALMLPATAAAHISVSPETAPAGGYAMLDFSVPHGCDAAATNQIAVRMPAQVISATPEEVAGWTLKVKEGKLPEPVEQHGEQVTEGVREVTWTGGPLPDGHLQRFGLSVAFAGESGEMAPFKIIQGCVNGEETGWIQEVTTDGPDPELPAPTVTLTAAEHSDDGAEPAAVVSNASESSSSNGLAIAALIVGALGLILGGVALGRTRRSGA